MYCWSCKNEIEITSGISRQQTCPNCTAYLHCCYNCRFYDKFAHNECKEPQAEWVNGKDMGNYCDYFIPSEKKPDSGKTLSIEEANKKFAQLLKKSTGKK